MERKVLLLAAVVACTGIGTEARASPIYHGDFVGQNVTFQNVHEDSATDPPPLYQVAGSQPILETLTIDGFQHDRLIFSPAAAFRASAHGGDYDITDGMLRFKLVPHPNTVLLHTNMAEGGDWSTQGSNTFVNANGGIITAQGTNVVGTKINVNYGDDIWAGEATLDLSNFTDEGTILITIDNVLEAYAGEYDGNYTGGYGDMYDLDELYPTARIAKKAFMIEIISIPEPGTLMLLGGGALLAFRRIRRPASARVAETESGHISCEMR